MPDQPQLSKQNTQLMGLLFGMLNMLQLINISDIHTIVVSVGNILYYLKELMELMVLLELMGGMTDGSFIGKSLVPFIRGGNVAEDHVFIEWHPNAHKVKPGSTLAPQADMDRVAQERTRAVVSPDGWKLCLSDVDKCQLFNLNSDPGETANLYDSGRHQDVIRRLTDRIHRWQEESRDQVVV